MHGRRVDEETLDSYAAELVERLLRIDEVLDPGPDGDYRRYVAGKDPGPVKELEPKRERLRCITCRRPLIEHSITDRSCLKDSGSSRSIDRTVRLRRFR